MVAIHTQIKFFANIAAFRKISKRYLNMYTKLCVLSDWADGAETFTHHCWDIVIMQ